MTDVMLGPLFTLVSIALPVGIACLAVGATVGRRSTRRRAPPAALVRPRDRWRAAALDAATRPGSGRAIGTARRGWSRRSIREVDAACRRWASGWPQLALAIRWVGRPRPMGDRGAAPARARSVEMAVAAAFPGAELDGAEPRRGWRCPRSGSRVRGEPPESAGPGTSSNLGAILVELLARLPDGASAAWRLRRHAAAARQGPAVRRRPGHGRDAPRLVPQPAVESRAGVGAALSRHARRARCSR